MGGWWSVIDVLGPAKKWSSGVRRPGVRARCCSPAITPIGLRSAELEAYRRA